MNMKNSPLLTALSFSGGKQSSALLWMILLNKIDVPDNFVVLTADPGMENSLTYEYIDMMRSKCIEFGIESYVVDGPNLYNDIMNLKSTNETRLDNPPYWTSSDGKLGRLRQKCTQYYKIYPMDRVVRVLLEQKFNVSSKSKRIGHEIVEKWIGFSYSEVGRVKPSSRKYQYFRYPLIEMKMTNDDVLSFYDNYNLPLPPRSVCNACFANGLDTLGNMYNHRPLDWNQAVNIDRAIRDWSQIGVDVPVFCSNTLLSLDRLAEIDFNIEDSGDLEDSYSCDSGYCFV